jgi:PAS domain S-box-containing protein
MQILYVDDEPDLLQMGKEFLELSGEIGADLAASAAAALEMFPRKWYDAVVSDYQMPGMNGIGLLKEIRGSGSDVPFIIFSGRGREEVVIEAINNGADFYLQKGADAEAVFAELEHKIGQGVARRRAERRIFESEARLRAIIGSSSDVVWEIDLDGRFTYLSPNCAAIFRAQPAQLLRSHFADMVPEQERNAIWSMMTSSFVHGDRVLGLCHQMRRADGTCLEVETSAGPIADYRGSSVAYAGVTKDISAARKAERRHRESEQRFKSMVENSPDCLWEVDRDFRVVYISPQSRVLSGYAPEEIIGGSLVDHIPPAEQEAAKKEFHERLGRNGALRDFQCRAMRKDGSMAVLESNATMIREGGEMIGVLGQTRDVSHRLATEQALRNANARLSLLSSITRHDIMNQLMVLKGYLELQESMAQDEVRRINLMRIREAAEKIQEQLVFAKQYERMGLDEPAWIPLESIKDKLEQEARVKGVVCTVDGVGYEIYADNMLDKVFLNLLDNSVRHGKGVTRVNMRTERASDGLHIFFEDNGAGIPDRTRARLFQRGHGSNTGLGLFLAKEILGITDLGIRECGEKGGGARFDISVPNRGFRASPE